MLISLGRISRHFFSPSQFDPLLCCCKVRLWRDEREIHTCLCLAIDILLTPFFFSTSPSPHLSLSSCFLRWSVVANPSSRPPLARSGHPISHGFTLSLPPQSPALEKLTQQPTHSSTQSFLSFNLTSVLEYSVYPFTFFTLSLNLLWNVCRAFRFVPFCISTSLFPFLL